MPRLAGTDGPATVDDAAGYRVAMLALAPLLFAVSVARAQVARSVPLLPLARSAARPPVAAAATPAPGSVAAETTVHVWHGAENGKLAGGLKAFFGARATVLEVLRAYERTPIGELIAGASAAEVRTVEGSLEGGRLVNVITGLRFPGTPSFLQGDVRRVITYDRANGAGRILVLNETGPLAGTRFDVRVTPDPEGRGAMSRWTLDGVQPWAVNDAGSAGRLAPLYNAMHLPSQALERAGRLLAVLAAPAGPAVGALLAALAAPERFWRASADGVAAAVSRILTERIQSGPAAIARRIDELRAAGAASAE